MISSTDTAAMVNIATADPPNQPATSCNTPPFFLSPLSRSSMTRANGHGVARSAASSRPRINTPNNNGRRSGRAYSRNRHNSRNVPISRRGRPSAVFDAGVPEPRVPEPRVPTAAVADAGDSEAGVSGVVVLEAAAPRLPRLPGRWMCIFFSCISGGLLSHNGHPRRGRESVHVRSGNGPTWGQPEDRGGHIAGGGGGSRSLQRRDNSTGNHHNTVALRISADSKV